MINFLKKKLIDFRNQYLWRKQESYLTFNEVSTLEVDNNLVNKKLGKVLVLVPHADDEWIGCSQVIQNNKDVEIYYFEFLGSNNKENNKRVRNNELLALCKQYNLKVNTINDCNTHEEALISLLQRGDYDSIFVPTFIDWHTEHIKVSYILRNVFSFNNELRLNLSYYFYQISVPLNNSFNKFFYGMTKKDVLSKSNVFEIYYSSQSNLPIYRFMLQDKCNTKFNSEIFAAEVYGQLSYENWIQKLEYIAQNEEQIKAELLVNINNIFMIRKISNSL